MENTEVPASAAWLGGLGALPFVSLAGVMPFVADGPRIFIAHSLVAYGATILSFLGGIHWGLAIGSNSLTVNKGLPGQLTMSIVPPLIGWCSLLVGSTFGLLILAAAIMAMLWVDIRATQSGQAPLWYPKLRVPLTCVVAGALLFGAIA